MSGVARAVAFVLAVLLSLALQPPLESSLGESPPPPVVGMTGGTAGTGTEGGAQMDWMKLGQFAITQGGLAVVLLVVIWSYRRDFERLLSRKDEEAARDRAAAAEDRRALIILVEKNTTALVHADQTNARLARAVEAHKLVPPGSTL